MHATRNRTESLCRHTKLVAQRLTAVVLLGFALMAMSVTRATAQVIPATAGAVGGFVAGTLVTTGVVVLEARLGHFIYGLDELVSLRPEVLPIIIGPVTGIVLGATSPETLRRAGRGALFGAVGGAIIGTGVGHLLWDTDEGRWAGGIIGAATGMVAGATIMALRKPDRNVTTQTPLATFSLRVPSIGGSSSRGGGNRE